MNEYKPDGHRNQRIEKNIQEDQDEFDEKIAKQKWEAPCSGTKRKYAVQIPITGYLSFIIENVDSEHQAQEEALKRAAWNAVRDVYNPVRGVEVHRVVIGPCGTFQGSYPAIHAEEL